MYVPRGLKSLNEILIKSDKILLYYDPDVDGLIAGNLMHRFLTSFGKSYSYYINENRKHGFKLKDSSLEKLRGYTIIMVDALITRLEVEHILSYGVNIINIDHHEIGEDTLIDIERNGARGVVINNQYPFEPSKYRFLSGAGVVYYVLNNICPNFCGEDERALVGISLLSDIREIENDIAFKFLYCTFNHDSDLMKYLVQVGGGSLDYGFGSKILDRNFIDYTLVPKINALFRLNKGDMAIDLLLGKFSDNLALEVFRNVQKEITAKIMDNLVVKEYSAFCYCYVDSIVNIGGYDISNFIGLVASNIKNRGKTTFVYLREGDKLLRGSVRGNSDVVNYLKIFREEGFVCEGHKNAFGVVSKPSEVDLERLNAKIEYLENELSSSKYEGRLYETNNLSFFMNGSNVKIADTNAYVRDNKRLYIKYTGDMDNVKVIKKNKVIEYYVNGIPVLCFDDTLDIKEDLILPLRERNNYISFFLRKY